MAEVISYNDLIDFQRVYTASSGGTVFSANLIASTAFDYFPNNAQVNDAIYFGFDNPRMLFKGIRFYVGTAFAATSYTLVWEYSRGGTTWTALSGVVDGTSNFSITGQNEVSWNWPTLACSYILVNGVYCDWVRCRITAVNTPTEGGAQSTQKLQARNGAITISNPGAESVGFCSKALAADVAGGWGVVSNLGTYLYRFNCHIFVGYSADASITTISDTLKSIEIDGLVWARKALSIIQLGTLLDATKMTVKDGCMITGTKLLNSMFADGDGFCVWKTYNSLLHFSCYTLVYCYNTIMNKTSFMGKISDTSGPRYSNALIAGVLDAST